MQLVKTVLADDHQIVLDGVKEILKTMPDLQVIGEASDGHALLHLVDHAQPQLVILDVNMPEKDGIQCTKELRRRYPSMKIIILTMYHSHAIIQEVMLAGAHGCVLKSEGSKQLREAINTVLSGKTFFQNIPQKEEPVEASVSEREAEIIKLVVEGMTSHEIAEKLFISEHTVRTHRKNIFRKLNLGSHSDLVRYAMSRGWIS